MQSKDAQGKMNAPVENAQEKAGESSRTTHVGHELLAHGTHLSVQCSTEHHDLLGVWCHLEDLLDVGAHVCIVKAT